MGSVSHHNLSHFVLSFSSSFHLSFSPTAVSAELNEPETTQLPQEQQQQQHYQQDQMPVSECQFAGSKVLNAQFGQTEERRSSSPSAGEHQQPHPDRGQISAERAAVRKMAQEEADYCSISSHHQQHHRLPPTHLGQLMGEHVCAVKRFLNRFVLISSHYRSYELTPSPEASTSVAVAGSSSSSSNPKPMSGLTHQATDSSTSEVIHLNAEQVLPKL